MIAIFQNPAHLLQMSAIHFDGVVPDAVSVILPATDSGRKSAALPTGLLTSATAVQRDVILTNGNMMPKLHRKTMRKPYGSHA